MSVTVIETFRADVRARQHGNQLRRIEEVARATGIPEGTLKNFVYRKNCDPRGSSIEKLAKFYDSNGRAA